MPHLVSGREPYLVEGQPESLIEGALCSEHEVLHGEADVATHPLPLYPCLPDGYARELRCPLYDDVGRPALLLSQDSENPWARPCQERIPLMAATRSASASGEETPSGRVTRMA